MWDLLLNWVIGFEVPCKWPFLDGRRWVRNNCAKTMIYTYQTRLPRFYIVGIWEHPNGKMLNTPMVSFWRKKPNFSAENLSKLFMVQRVNQTINWVYCLPGHLSPLIKALKEVVIYYKSLLVHFVPFWVVKETLRTFISSPVFIESLCHYDLDSTPMECKLLKGPSVLHGVEFIETHGKMGSKSYDRRWGKSYKMEM